MVFPPTERPYGRTLEDRLADKFDALQVAREKEDAGLFDALTESIETLFIGVPEAYKELMRIRYEMDRDLDEELMNIKREASYADNSIDRDAILKLRRYDAEWNYRREYEQVIMELMQKYRLIPMYRPVHSRIEAPEVTQSSPNMQHQYAQQKQKVIQEQPIQQVDEQKYRQIQEQVNKILTAENLTPEKATNIVAEPEPEKKKNRIFRKKRKQLSDESFEI